jgi:hypothetical protein
MSECFIVDWPVTGEASKPPSIVAVRMQGRQAGLYRVKQVMQEGLQLSHGAISFPVGTALDVEDVRGQITGIRHSAWVTANDQTGLSLSWAA